MERLPKIFTALLILFSLTLPVAGCDSGTKSTGQGTGATQSETGEVGLTGDEDGVPLLPDGPTLVREILAELPWAQPHELRLIDYSLTTLKLELHYRSRPSEGAERNEEMAQIVEAALKIISDYRNQPAAESVAVSCVGRYDADQGQDLTMGRATHNP